MNLTDLTKRQVNSLHKKYMKLQSLNQTVDYLLEKYDIEINRHQLSMFFKRKGLEVLPPNGRSVNNYRIMNKYASPESEMAANMLKLAIKDVKDFVAGRGKTIDFLSACYFFTSDLYQTVLYILGSDLDHENLPEGVTENVVRQGASLYMDGYNYWVLARDQ